MTAEAHHLPRAKFILSAGVGLLAMGAMVLLLGPRADEVAAAAARVPVWVFALTLVLGVCSLLLRAEVWGTCLEACGGRRASRSDLHVANSLGMLANGFNHYLGPFMRIGALRRLAPNHAPRPAQMVAADVPVLLAEAGLLVLLLATVAGAAGMDWWIPVATAVGVCAGLLALWTLRARFAHQPLMHGLNVLANPRYRRQMLVCIAAATALQVGRTWLLLEGVGLDPAYWQVAMTFITTGVLGVLPLGPTTSSGATLAVFGAQSATAAAAAGVVLTASALVAALLYCGAAGVMLVRRLIRARRANIALALA